MPPHNKLSLEEIKKRIFLVHGENVKIVEETFIDRKTKCKFVDIDFGEWETYSNFVYYGARHPNFKKDNVLVTLSFCRKRKQEEIKKEIENFIFDLNQQNLVQLFIDLAYNKNYCYAMFYEFLKRDYSDIFQKYNFSKQKFGKILKNLGVCFDNKICLKLSQAEKLQYQYPKEMSINDIKKDIYEKSKLGAQITCEKRKNHENYNPKNKPEFYENLGFLKKEAENLAFLQRSKHSPFSKNFSKYSDLNEIEKENIITSLSRSRGLKGLLALKSGVSQLEIRVVNFLKEKNFEVIQQIILGEKYSYDIFLPKFNQIIEVNGDYWHANPKFYEENDLVYYPFGTVTAKNRWNKDNEKINYAKLKGYKIDTLWEDELKQESFLNEYINKFY